MACLLREDYRAVHFDVIDHLGRGEMMRNLKIGLAAAVTAVALAGCMTATQHAAQLPSASERRLTLGVVQRDIHKGMAQSDVATALGSPNIVTQDANGEDTWIYDKIATESAYSQSSASASLGGLLVGGSGAALGGVGASQSSGAASQTQRTLTVVIKFHHGHVASINYNSSSF